MNATTTVWILYLSKPETFCCGPYYSLEEGIEAGRGKVEDPKLREHQTRVNDGLLSRYDNVPTTSLREQHAHYLSLNPVLLKKLDGTPYTDAELDRRYADPVHVAKRIAVGRKLTAL